MLSPNFAPSNFSTPEINFFEDEIFTKDVIDVLKNPLFHKSFANLIKFAETAPLDILINKINFNAVIENQTESPLSPMDLFFAFENGGSYSAGNSLLGAIAQASFQDERPRQLLKIILNRVPASNLDFNYQSISASPLHSIIELIDIDPSFIMTLLEKNETSKFNFNLPYRQRLCQSTPLLNITRKALGVDANPLIKLLEKASFEELAFTPTILLNIFNTVLHNNDLILETFIERYKTHLYKLDFSARLDISYGLSPEMGISIKGLKLRECLLQSPLTAPFMNKIDKIICKHHINEVRKIWETLSNEQCECSNSESYESFNLHIAQLETFIEKAHQEKVESAYLLLAKFYCEIGALDQLKEIAKKLPIDYLYRNEILDMTAREVAFGMHNDALVTEETAKINKKEIKRKRKKNLEEAFDYALQMSESNELRKIIAFSYAHISESTPSGKFPSSSKDSVLDNLRSDKDTSKHAMFTLRKKIKLENKVAEIDKLLAEKDKKIIELEEKLARFTR